MPDTANGEELHDAIVEIDPALYRRVLGHYPTGVVVVAGVDDGHPVGLAIGSFFAVYFDVDKALVHESRGFGVFE